MQSFIDFLELFLRYWKKLDSIIFILLFFLSMVVYAFLCLQLSILPVMLLLFFINNVRWLGLLFNRFVFYIVSLLSISCLLLLFYNFLICSFHFQLAFPIVSDVEFLFENLKKNILFINSISIGSAVAPINNKEASIEEFIYKANVCHQEIVDNGINRLVIVVAEHKSGTKYRETFKLTNSILPPDQSFLLRYYLSLAHINGYTDLSGSLKGFNLVSAYTHSYDSTYEVPNLLLSNKDLYGNAYWQYMTQFYRVHPSFFNHCIRIGIEAPDFETNRLVPIKFFQKTGQATYSGLLVTGSKDYTATAHPDVIQSLKGCGPADLICGRNNKTADSFVVRKGVHLSPEATKTIIEKIVKKWR